MAYMLKGHYGYYTGQTYRHQGEVFACSDVRKKAKEYTSKKRAENAKDSLDRKVEETFQVVEEE